MKNFFLVNLLTPQKMLSM